MLLNLEITGTIQCEVLKHPAVNVVFDDFHLVAAKAMIVVFPSHQLVELCTAGLHHLQRGDNHFLVLFIVTLRAVGGHVVFVGPSAFRINHVIGTKEDGRGFCATDTAGEAVTAEDGIFHFG